VNRYAQCPKHVGPNDRRDESPLARVGSECLGKPRDANIRCAVGGGRFPDGESEDWVCWVHHHSTDNPDSDACGDPKLGILYDTDDG